MANIENGFIDEVQLPSGRTYNYEDAYGRLYYFTDIPVSVATSSEIMRFPSGSGAEYLEIDENTIVVSCVFAEPRNITSDVEWTSYSGYITFTGTCTAATTANLIIAQQGTQPYTMTIDIGG